MGDTPAPASKRKDSSQTSNSALPKSQAQLTRAMSTAPPTEDIDSEWPSDDEPVARSPLEAAGQSDVSASANALAQASADESEWNASDDAASALTAPTFPSDPGLPHDLRSPGGISSSRPAPVAESSPQSRRDMDTVPAAPQASRPPNSSAGNGRSRANSDAVGGTGAELRASQAPAEAAPPSQPAAPAPEPRFESSPPRVVSLSAAVSAARPEASSDARHSFDPHVHLSEPVQAKRPSRAPLLLALVASAAAALLLMRGGGVSSPTASKTPTAVGNVEPQPEKPAASEAPKAEPARAEPARAEPAHAAPANAELAHAEPSNAPAPSGADATAGAAVAAPTASAGNVSVLIRVRPPQARIFYRGKEVGKAPVTVEIEPGKRRAYEVSLPGFMTRKVIVDGSATELSVGLRPDPSAPAAN